MKLYKKIRDKINFDASNYLIESNRPYFIKDQVNKNYRKYDKHLIKDRRASWKLQCQCFFCNNNSGK